MSTPGFTAEASLYRSSQHYFASASELGGVVLHDAGVSAALGWNAKLGAGAGVFSTCDRIGGRCCGPDGAVNTQHCHNSLGCNVATGLCEMCGGPGQVCCDGDYTGFSNKSYTGIILDSNERTQSCDPGSRCDATLRTIPLGLPGAGQAVWTGSRRCQGCGTKTGGPCCAPDNSNALGHCFKDATTGAVLVCNKPYTGAAGVCIECGHQAYQPACPTAPYCADGMVPDEKTRLCVPCGWPGQPTCDRGEPCRAPNSVPGPFYDQCVAAGGPNQPCLKNGGCGYQDLFCNSEHICEPCGDGGQPCCPPSAGSPPCRSGVCILLGMIADPASPEGTPKEKDRCFACGYENMPVCPGGDPCPHGGEPVDGWCRPCGGEGQVCCRSLSIICDTSKGLHCEDNVCRKSGGGGGGGTQWVTCSGQPYTLSTVPWPVYVEDTHGCVAHDTFLANSQNEALQCARTKWGSAVIGTLDDVQEFKWSEDCRGICSTITFHGRDEAGAERCAQFTFPDCTLAKSPCP